MSTNDQEGTATGNDDATARIEEEVDRLYARMQAPEDEAAAERAFGRRPRVRLRRGAATDPEHPPVEGSQPGQGTDHPIGRQQD